MGVELLQPPVSACGLYVASMNSIFLTMKFFLNVAQAEVPSPGGPRVKEVLLGIAAPLWS